MDYNNEYLSNDLRNNYKEIHVFLKDENRNVLGGILGEIYANWLEIKIFMMEREI